MVARQNAWATTSDSGYVQPSWVEETDDPTLTPTTEATSTDTYLATTPPPVTDTYASTTDAAATFIETSTDAYGSSTTTPYTDSYDSYTTSQSTSDIYSSSDTASTTSTSFVYDSSQTTTQIFYSVQSATTTTSTSTSTPTLTETPTSTTTTIEPSRSFSITSSTATPSLVLGTNECASDPNAVNGICPQDRYFCNAATASCIQLMSNGAQCYEDFQCASAHCDNGTCGVDGNSAQPSALTGADIAGITIGSVAGAVALIACLAFAFQRRSRRHRVSWRARKFEQIRYQDDNDEFWGEPSRYDHPDVMEEHNNHRSSKYNVLAQLMTDGGSLSQGTETRDLGGRITDPRAIMRESKVEAEAMDDDPYDANLGLAPAPATLTGSSPPGMYERKTHASWLSASSAIDPFGAAAAAAGSPPRPEPLATRDYLAPQEPYRRSPELDAAKGRGSWLLKEIAARWQQGSSSGARESAISTISGSVHTDDHPSSATTTQQKRSSLSTAVHKDLWDDSLASTTTAGSTLERSSSIASSHPHHNPRDSLIMHQPRINTIPEDAWNSEDQESLRTDQQNRRS